MTDTYEQQVAHRAAELQLERDAERLLREQDRLAELKQWQAENKKDALEARERQRQNRVAQADAKARWAARGPSKYLPRILISLALIAGIVVPVSLIIASDAPRPECSFVARLAGECTVR
ncbi:hypothetical protein [Cryobacterium zhongshanensis]|uniref:Uncharacterized protein n=1 Tax=Cryobacterium zhongshanensis TaxID=2928153 RepID=A0AA41QY92_9MICO|nr:hypothetical protein [Cryobacterium zhongshanensis]MCI4659745.1 hypothetical protein [Cryobacterium zhongshanensis]